MCKIKFYVSTLWEEFFSGWWFLRKSSRGTLTNAGGDILISVFESSTESRCVLPAISSSPDTLAIKGAVTGAQWHSCIRLSDVKKIASKEPSGTTGVQPVCGRQVRREKWPIMILLEISQHAVVEVRFLWCLSAFYGRNRRQSGLTAQGMCRQEIIFLSVFTAFQLREVVSNRSKSFIRSEGLWQWD